MASAVSHINIPSKGNLKLEAFMEQVNADEELAQLWKSANINVVDRSGMSDHGPVHIQIVANAAYKMMRLLTEAGIPMSAVKDHGLTTEDSSVIVVGGAVLHDVGMAVQRENHEIYGVALSWEILRRLLSPLYGVRERTLIAAEILHTIIAHQVNEVCLSIEAGIVKVADALDMTHGRSRIPFEAGQINIHSVSAQAVESVRIEKGQTKPIHLEIKLDNYAGIFQVDELLKPKLRTSTIAPYVEVSASVSAELGQSLGIVFSGTSE